LKKKQKSPTKNDIVKVVDILIQESQWTQRKLDGLAYAFNSYIDMKKDTEEFNKLIKEKVKQEKESAESTKNDSKGSTG
tara:strand:+ start:157 stop:393 length:237 start_codon:yes stop_codon:yes gene_type:complete